MGTQKHFLGRFFVQIPFFAVSPIFLVQFPPLVGVILAGLEPLELFVLVDVYPKLHDNRSKMPVVILHLVDFVVSLLPIGLPAKTFHPLDQDTPIPRTVENGSVTGFRELRRETQR